MGAVGQARPGRFFRPGLLMLVCTALLGCAAGPPRAETTMLGSVDLVRMTDRMSASLLAADVLDEGMVIATDRVVNRTNHIMHEGEREHFLVRLRAHLAQNESLRDAGVTFVARPDEVSQFARPADSGDRGKGPTHALTATFLSLTHVTRQLREDLYECAFQLQDLRSREIIWEDAYGVEYSVSRGKYE